MKTDEIDDIDLWELFDLDKQEFLIHSNYEEIKRMPRGEEIIDSGLKKIEKRRKELRLKLNLNEPK